MKLTTLPNVNPAPLRTPQTPPAGGEPTPPPAPKKEKVIAGYSGPEDGMSHYNADAAKWLLPVNKGIVHLWRNMDVQGKENIPDTGAHMLCFNHNSYSDASIVQTLTNRDYRFMAAKEQFVGPIGKAMTALGSVPVDRGATSTKPIEVMTELMNNGIGTAIAPEGRINELPGGAIGEFKGGPALMALRSQCESMVPVVIHYEKHAPTVGDKVKTYLTASAVVAGGLAAALAGGPALRALSGVLTGALTGAAAGAGVGFATSDAKDTRGKLTGSLKSAGIGAALGAVGGGVGGAALGANAVYLAAPLSVGAGLLTLAGAKAYHERTEAHVVVGKGIPVAPYREMEDKGEARKKLTEDLRNTMVAMKADIVKSLHPEENKPAE
jgi:hypothetical protein